MKTFLLSLMVFAMPVEMPKLPYANDAFYWYGYYLCREY